MLRTTALACLALSLSACALSHELPGDGGSDTGMTRPDAGPECSMVGRFSATIDGTEVVFVFADDGTWLVELDGMPVAPPMSLPRYSFDGTTFRIYNPEGSDSASCGPDRAGVYTLSFSDGCASVRFRLVRDPCAERSASLDGMRMTRVR